MMKKRILTMFWYDDASEVHLYKDVGGIPYALAKYCDWQATFAYNDINGIIHNDDYEKYVKLDTIHYPKILCKLKMRYYKYFQVIKYVWKNAPKYDVINFYHCHKFIRFLCWLAKKANPNIITYVKLDMGREGFCKEQKNIRGEKWESVSIFTVEASKYVEDLNKLCKFNGKVQYLPNGFFSDMSNVDKDIDKEKIILTVGRLGTYQKNTELLVDTFFELDKSLICDWRLFLVGPVTPAFKKWLQNRILDSKFHQERIVLTGNIVDKSLLYKIYSKSPIFVLPSRFESWGLVILEAMYFENYPILTNCCDAYYDFLYDNSGSYGNIIKNDNKKELKQAIISAIENYDNKMNIAKQGSKFINENFNWNVVAKQLEQYFMDINNEVVK